MLDLHEVKRVKEALKTNESKIRYPIWDLLHLKNLFQNFQME
jgi:hypothetical protein